MTREYVDISRHFDAAAGHFGQIPKDIKMAAILSRKPLEKVSSLPCTAFETICLPF
ncbi:MAG: hypothetical protein R3E02_04845 [Blastomonas sp.]